MSRTPPLVDIRLVLKLLIATHRFIACRNDTIELVYHSLVAHVPSFAVPSCKPLQWQFEKKRGAIGLQARHIQVTLLGVHGQRAYCPVRREDIDKLGLE